MGKKHNKSKVENGSLPLRVGFAALFVSVLFIVLFLFINYGPAHDEAECRRIWICENGKMQEFVAEHVSSDVSVYLLCDDYESAVTVRRYVEWVKEKEPHDWISMPAYWKSIDKFDRHLSGGEMQKMLAQIETGDLLIVPLSRANVGYNRMPAYGNASRLFPNIVPQAVRGRLEQIYQSFQKFDHKTVPPMVVNHLKKNARTDILEKLKETGMTFGFGWAVYRVKQG